jgi:hypothetical protein
VTGSVSSSTGEISSPASSSAAACCSRARAARRSDFGLAAHLPQVHDSVRRPRRGDHGVEVVLVERDVREDRTRVVETADPVPADGPVELRLLALDVTDHVADVALRHGALTALGVRAGRGLGHQAGGDRLAGEGGMSVPASTRLS